jgi:hypothetical protein
MSQPKPLASRLDDIEAKMEELIELNKATIKATQDFRYVDLEEIKKQINKEVSKDMTESLMKFQSIPMEWLTFVSYCIDADLEPAFLFKLFKKMRES